MSSIAKRIDNLIAELDDILKEAELFDNGNASAGARTRKVLLEAKKECDSIRKEITAIKNKRKQ